MSPDDSPSELATRTAAQFATTHWSTVLAAGDSASPESSAALEKLFRSYWFPLYAFVRRKDYPPEDAKDLIQGFLLYLLERHVIDKARPELGRFRSFPLGCLKNYLAQQRDRARAEKRGGDRQLLSLDATEAESRLRTEPAREVTPETLFDQKWGVTVLAQALKSLEAEYSRSGQARVFQRLHPFLQGDCARLAYREAAEGLGMAEPAVRMAVTRLRRRYRDALRSVVAETVSDPKDIDAELRYLIQIQAQ
jgi:RNA polymerase sigma-70 factor (ECF subfamily)